MRNLDLTGRVFGRLTALTREPLPLKGSGFLWTCLCACGNTCRVLARNLTYKLGVRSCGCLLTQANRSRPNRPSTNLTHGQTARRGLPASGAYVSWSSMKQRCLNPKNTNYRNYGSKGVTIDAQWLDFERFYSDMGDRPEGMSLDRINVSEGYCKGNCRWATSAEQASNKAGTVQVRYSGSIYLISELSSLTDIPERTLHRWAKEGAGQVQAKILKRLLRPSVPSGD